MVAGQRVPYLCVEIFRLGKDADVRIFVRKNIARTQNGTFLQGSVMPGQEHDDLGAHLFQLAEHLVKQLLHQPFAVCKRARIT